MIKIFLSSDHHFGHSNILQYCRRPFKDVNHMNTGLIDNWNAVVSPEDVVFYLGDFSLSGDIYPYLSRLNGTKYLILGNHDKAFKNKYVHKALHAGFKSVSRTMQWEISSLRLNLCHFPYKGSGDHTYIERYKEYRLKDTGQILLHGHSHLPPEKKIRRTSKGALMYDCGVDANNYFPVSLEQIIEELRNAQ